MISSKTIRFSALHQVIEHMIPDSITHAKDKEFFSEGWASCDAQPFLDCRQLLPELAAYNLIGDGILAPSDIAVFRESARGYDQRGRKRKGTVAYKLIVSASDRVQGYLCAVDDRGLRIDLCRIVHWHSLRTTVTLWNSDFVVGKKGRRSKSRLGAYLLAAPHWDTARFHTEILFAVHGPDNRRRIRGVRSDGALISALASRHAAGFEEPDFKIKHENLRWNSILAMRLEEELLELCREFYRAHGLDFTAAEKKTAWLQVEGRSALGKALAERRDSPALRYKSPEAGPVPSNAPAPASAGSVEAGAVPVEVVKVVEVTPEVAKESHAPDEVNRPLIPGDDPSVSSGEGEPASNALPSPRPKASTEAVVTPLPPVAPAKKPATEAEAVEIVAAPVAATPKAKPEVTVTSKGPAKIRAERGPKSRAVPTLPTDAHSKERAAKSSPPSAGGGKATKLSIAELRLIHRDLAGVSQGEAKENLRRPTDWQNVKNGLDLDPKIRALLEGDDSEDSREILLKRKLMLRLQNERKEKERRSVDQSNEMSH